MAFCADDFDCPGTLVCYSNVSWNDFNLTCACSTWYGWKGPDCTELDKQAILYLFFVSFSMAIATTFFLYTLRDILRVLSMKELREFNSTTYTLFFASAGLLSAFLWRVFSMLNILQPEGHDQQIPLQNEKLAAAQLPERIFIMFSTVFAIASALEVSLMWIDVASRVKSFQTTYSKQVRVYRRIVNSVQLLFFATITITGSIGRWNFVLFAAIPVIVIMAIAFLFGRIGLVRILDEAAKMNSTGLGTGDSARFKQSAARVKTTSSIVTISLIGISVFGPTQAVTQINWKEYAEPGEFNPVPFFAEMVILFIIVANSAIAVYVHANVETRRGNVIAKTTESAIVSSSNQEGSHNMNSKGSMTNITYKEDEDANDV